MIWITRVVRQKTMSHQLLKPNMFLELLHILALAKRITCFDWMLHSMSIHHVGQSITDGKNEKKQKQTKPQYKHIHELIYIQVHPKLIECNHKSKVVSKNVPILEKIINKLIKNEIAQHSCLKISKSHSWTLCIRNTNRFWCCTDGAANLLLLIFWVRQRFPFLVFTTIVNWAIMRYFVDTVSKMLNII